MTTSLGVRFRALVSSGYTKPSSMRQLWRPIVETTGANFFTLGASAITVFITARYLGPDGRFRNPSSEGAAEVA